MNRSNLRRFAPWHFLQCEVRLRIQCVLSYLAFVLILVAAIEPSAHAELVTLYSGSGLPSAEPWLVYGFDSITGASQTSVAGGVRLVTDGATRAGYSNYNVIPTTAL